MGVWPIHGFDREEKTLISGPLGKEGWEQ